MPGLLVGKFIGSGQTCVSPNRIYVQSGIHDAFVAEFTKLVKEQIRTGAVEDDQTALGCVINSKALDKIEQLVADAKSKGAKALVGGERSDPHLNLYPATILTGMNPEMKANRTELFGPVATVYRFDTEEEVIAQANQSEVGLGAYVYTENLPTAWRVAEALQGESYHSKYTFGAFSLMLPLVGMTGINTGMFDPVAPFGGVKESGFGVEGGRHGIEEFQISKVWQRAANSSKMSRLLTPNDADYHARRSRPALHSSVGLTLGLKQAHDATRSSWLIGCISARSLGRSKLSHSCL